MTSSNDIRDKLLKTNRVFFSRFPTLTDVQNQTIPKILEGQNCLIISPTASGKTEAVIAPICERILSEHSQIETLKHLLVVYVIPTRALVNDIYKRLEDSLLRLNISIASKTSDRDNFKIENPQNILFTTPESLDSLLMRHPQVLKNLEYVIIDELHFLDNNYRGDQLRVLLKRLKEKNIVSEKLKMYAMSATIHNPNELGKRYFESFELIISKGSREIVFEAIGCDVNFKNLKKIYDIFYHKKILRAIFFCNSRRTTITITKKLKEIFHRDDRIFEHHSSLSSIERKRVETEMNRTDKVLSLCVATSSLEIGIDIGNLEAIVLVEPPLTVSSLMQRIGRGNRRTNRTICYGIYDVEEDKKTFDDMINDAKNELIEEIEYEPDLSVCVQQILSLSIEKTKSNERLSRKKIHEILHPLEKDYEKIDMIIDKLISDEYIEERRNSIIPITKLLDYDYKTRGRVNVNIPGGYGILKVETVLGEQLGEIANPHPKFSKIQFASNKWTVVGTKNDKIVVERSNTGKTEVPRFASNGTKGYYYSWLPKELKKKI